MADGQKTSQNLFTVLRMPSRDTVPLTFGFKCRDGECFEFTFQSKNNDVKATCAMKSGRIVVHENVYFSNMTITKERARSLLLKLSKLLI